MREIIPTDEAFWSPRERLFARTVAFLPPPRRSTARGHLIAVLIGAALAAVVIGLGL